jgi:hypothetical protein
MGGINPQAVTKGGLQVTKEPGGASQRVPPGLRGLTNVRSSCWFNALTSLLFHKAPLFVDLLTRVASRNAVAARNKTACDILEPLLTLAQQVLTPSPGNHAVSADSFWARMRTIQDTSSSGPETKLLLRLFKTKNMEDPRELLNRLVGFLGETCQATPFDFQLQKAISCDNCGVPSRRILVSQERMLHLPVVHGDLHCSLQEYFSRSSGQSNIFCPRCGCGGKKDQNANNLVEELSLGLKSPPHLLFSPLAHEIVSSTGIGGQGDASGAPTPQSSGRVLGKRAVGCTRSMGFSPSPSVWRTMSRSSGLETVSPSWMTMLCPESQKKRHRSFPQRSFSTLNPTEAAGVYRMALAWRMLFFF